MKNSPQAPIALNAPDDTAEIAKELRDRMTYFYGQSDGSFRFPNSCEGDLLRMTARLLARLPNAKVRDAECRHNPVHTYD